MVGVNVGVRVFDLVCVGVCVLVGVHVLDLVCVLVFVAVLVWVGVWVAEQLIVGD